MCDNCKTEQTQEEFYTPEELAGLLKLSVKFVRKHSFKIPGRVKVGHLVRYEKNSVMRALTGGNFLIK